MPLKKKLDLNEKFLAALHLMENTRENIFLTGQAGTGKSTLLEYFRSQTKKNIVVLAPTGVAAVNVKGQTIHSFFGFKPNVTLSKVRRLDKAAVYENLETIVIDEVSMVRADLLDYVDKFLRLNGRYRGRPFGGCQMIFIGDLYQLPPVVTTNEEQLFNSMYQTPYFFSARVFDREQRLISDASEFKLTYVELDKIYRQKDNTFIQLLNAVRNNTVTPAELQALNARYLPGAYKVDHENLTVCLTTTNDMAAKYNSSALAQLAGDYHEFEGKTEGRFAESALPTEMVLRFKTGSQVMMLNNDQAGRWYNGTIGRVKSVAMDPAGPNRVMVELPDGKVIEVIPHRWDMYKFVYDKSAGQIEAESAGSFSQYPFKLAWAITIHKSQGKTFDNVVIDIGRGTFTSGQLYVALSRCTSLDGVVLKTPISLRNIWVDERIIAYKETTKT